jgi:predicted lipoprotein with Yx(FWY)xxD motif
MRRLVLLIPVLAVLLAACGSSSNDNNSAPASSSAPTVGVKQVSGLGSVLVDAQGAALYTPEQEANGMIRCTGTCTSFWIPLKAPTSITKASGVDGRLASIARPDGTKQVTLNGKPLYSFSEDSGGKVTGNGFKDSFGGTAFTWHAVTTSGTASTDSSSSGSSGGNYGY